MKSLLFAVSLSVVFSSFSSAQTPAPVSGRPVTNWCGRIDSGGPAPSACECAQPRLPAARETSTKPMQPEQATSGANQPQNPQLPPAPGDNGPRDGMYQALLSVFHSDAGRFEQAKAHASEAVRLLASTDTAGQFYARGVAYQQLGKYDSAMADFNKSLQLEPQRAMAYYNRGGSYPCKGDSDRAIADYGKAIELNPREAPAYFHRAFIYSARGD